VSMAENSTVTHGDQKAVNDALAGARKRPIQGAGGFGWDRRDESVNIAPIVSATLALLGGMTKRRTGTGGATFA
jgi:phosphoribosylformylglycinamidine (FGAM) synthase-like enzyme